jgi:hypothetical protein
MSALSRSLHRINSQCREDFYLSNTSVWICVVKLEATIEYPQVLAGKQFAFKAAIVRPRAKRK